MYALGLSDIEVKNDTALRVKAIDPEGQIEEIGCLVRHGKIHSPYRDMSVMKVVSYKIDEPIFELDPAIKAAVLDFVEEKL